MKTVKSISFFFIYSLIKHTYLELTQNICMIGVWSNQNIRKDKVGLGGKVIRRHQNCIKAGCFWYWGKTKYKKDLY